MLLEASEPGFRVTDVTTSSLKRCPRRSFAGIVKKDRTGVTMAILVCPIGPSFFQLSPDLVGRIRVDSSLFVDVVLLKRRLFKMIRSRSVRTKEDFFNIRSDRHMLNGTGGGGD